MVRLPEDLTGKRFCRLVVLRNAGVPTNKHYWTCQCDCGTVKTVHADRLRRGNTRSCGCLKSEVTSARLKRDNFVHGMSHTLTHLSWCAMMARCHNPNQEAYAKYGARGIVVCGRWHTYENFLADMGERPSKAHSIDRFPNQEGNYEPGNCRWATRAEQNRNKRTNRLVTIDGETLCLMDWATRSGMSYDTLFKRLTLGWSGSDLLQPPGFRRTARRS